MANPFRGAKRENPPDEIRTFSGLPCVSGGQLWAGPGGLSAVPGNDDGQRPLRILFGMGLCSLVFAGIVFAVSRLILRSDIPVLGLAVLLLAGLWGWLYPLLPPAFVLGSLSFSFNSYTSLSGGLLIVFSGYGFYRRCAGRHKGTDQP